MTHDRIGGDETLARALATVIAANGRIHERELSALSGLGAFERLGVTPDRLVQLARDCICDLGVGLQRRHWLDGRDLAYIDARLAAIVDPQLRLLLCRWAAAVMVADGCVTHEERLVYRHVLRRWRISHVEVARAASGDQGIT